MLGKTKFIYISAIVIILGLAFFPLLVSGQSRNNGDYSDLNSVPSNCPQEYEVDFSCQKAKILSPSVSCFLHKCPDAPSYAELQKDDSRSGQGSEDKFSLDAFGARFSVDSGKEIAAIVNISISTFLGVVSLYSLVRAFYVAGVKIAGTVDSEKLEEAKRELIQLVLAFVIAWSAIFILQIVFTVLGLGNINDYVFFGEDSSSTQIVIN
jgi:hypothetical protein